MREGVVEKKTDKEEKKEVKRTKAGAIIREVNENDWETT